MGLVIALTTGHPSVQTEVSAERAHVPPGTGAWTGEHRSNRHTCKIKILLVMQVCHFYTGCLGHRKRSWKGNPDTANKILNIFFKSWCSFCILWSLCLYRSRLPKGSVYWEFCLGQDKSDTPIIMNYYSQKRSWFLVHSSDFLIMLWKVTELSKFQPSTQHHQNHP